jgi:hypothetical protein
MEAPPGWEHGTRQSGLEGIHSAVRTVQPPVPVRTATAAWATLCDPHTVASEGRELAGFGPADYGLVRRGRMLPAGKLHAVLGDETACGVPLGALYLFPQLRFWRSYAGRQCPDCQAATGLEWPTSAS